MQNIFDTILLNILIFCERLKISLHDLKYSKIGKMVNNFTVTHYEEDNNFAKIVVAYDLSKMVEIMININPGK